METGSEEGREVSGAFKAGAGSKWRQLGLFIVLMLYKLLR